MKKLLLFIFSIIAFSAAEAQVSGCVNQGAIGNPGCGGLTTRGNMGSKTYATAVLNAGDFYCASISSGSNGGCGTYSVTPTNFVAGGGTTFLSVLGNGSCCWTGGARTCATLSLRKSQPTISIVPTQVCETVNVGISRGSTCGGFTPSLSENGVGSLSGTTYVTGNPSSNQFVTITASLGNCTATDGFTVFSQISSVTITNPISSLCEGQSYDFNGTINGSGSGSLSWSMVSGPGSINSSTGVYTAAGVAVNTSVTIRLTGSNGPCADRTATETFTILAQPSSVSINNPSGDLCEGSPNYDFNATINGNGNAGSLTWSETGPGSINTSTGVYTVPSVSINTAVSVSVTADNGACSPVSTTYNFTILAQPSSVSINNPSGDLCEGSPNYDFNATINGNGNAGSLTWSETGPGSINTSTGVYTVPSVSVNTAVSVSVTADNGACSPVSTSYNFTILAQPSSVSIDVPLTTICDTESPYDFNATINGNGGTGTLTWSETGPGTINASNGVYTIPDVAVNTPVSVTVVADNGACSTVSSTNNFTVLAEPSITSSSSSMCEGDTRTLTSDVAGVTFSGPGVSGNTFTAPSPGGVTGNYVITVNNGGSCNNIQVITVFGIASITSSSASMCEGQTRTLTASLGGGIFSGPGVSGNTFTAPTPVGASQTYTISYTTLGSPCPSVTQDITVFKNPSFATAGSDLEGCVDEAVTMQAAAPTVGTGTWTWSPSTPTYVGGTNANTPNAQVVFSAGNLYTGTWTISNGPCTTVSDDATVDVFSVANNAFLVSGTSTSAVESCEEGTWTYYANPATPNEYIFGIRKNGNTFTADVTITDLPGNTTYSSTGGAGPDRGTWLIGRYWNAELTSGSIGSSVDIRFFFDPAEITQAQNEANTFLNSTIFATDITPLTFFKTTGTNFNPTSAMLGGDFTFTPTYLSYSVGAIGGVTYIEMTGITSFSGGTGGFSVNDDGSTLPVELLYFDASNVNNEFVQLDWATATEINNDGFEVLRSTDGINFERIAWVEGKGNSTETNEYLYEDRSVAKGITYYYQLKQVDFDGEFELFDIASVRLEGTSTFNIGNLVPNPSKENTMISVAVESASEEQISIRMFNHVGVQVANLVKTVSQGSNLLEIEVKDLAAGTYFMNFESSFGTETRKLVVIR